MFKAIEAPLFGIYGSALFLYFPSLCHGQNMSVVDLILHVIQASKVGDGFIDKTDARLVSRCSVVNGNKKQKYD